MRNDLRFLFLAAAVAGPMPAGAVPACSIDGVVSVAFGSYDVFSPAPLDSAGSVTYSCTGAVGGDLVGIELSRGGAPSYSPRLMSQGAATMSYNLYRDAAHTDVWGDGTGGTSRYTLSGAGNNDTIVVNVYGRIPAMQNVTVGAYGDTVTVTLQF